MGLTLYGNPRSTCTNRVLVVIAEKGLTCELVTIDLFKGEHKQPSYIEKQPFGKIPVLDDDGFLIFESRAICKYLATKYASKGNNLVPVASDFQAYGLFEQACSIEMSSFDSPTSIIAFEGIYKAMLGKGQADKAVVERSLATLDANFAVYESILSKQAYLAGNEVTLADLFHLPYGAMTKNLGLQELFNKYNHVAKWFANLEARDSWKNLQS